MYPRNRAKAERLWKKKERPSQRKSKRKEGRE